MGVLNNPDCSLDEIFDKVPDLSYGIGQLEIGEETKTPHLQFVVGMKKPQRLSAMKKINNAVHWEVCRSEDASIKYCSKNATRLDGPWERGQQPFKRNDKKDWERAKELAMENKLNEIPADILIPHYRNLKMLASDYMVAGEATSHTKGIWVFGRSG